MCDYCDCRTRPPLDRLGQDHERIATVARRLRTHITEGDVEARTRDAQELRTLLERHDRVEEAGLYPELDGAGVPTAELRAEHDAVDAVLRAAADRAPVPGDSVRQALDALEAHIRREEYDLFPAAHQLIDDAGWDRIDRSMEAG